MTSLIDMTNLRFGNVVVLRIAPPSKGKAKWVCVCDCGSEFTTCGGKLRCGDVISCQKCSKKRVQESRTTHGQRRSAEYRIWTHIKSRCLNEKVPEFKHYGGRGVFICDRWKNSFENFLADMGPRPGPQYSIDRRDNDGGYEPNNCRWASKKEQANNTRANRRVTIGHETKNMTQWADEIGVKREVIHKRLKRGVDISRLLEPTARAKTFAFRGIVATIPEWSKSTGINRATLYWRINKQNWPLEKALTEGEKF